MASVLVVDDDANLLKQVSEVLKHAKHRVVTAEHPPQALVKLENEEFDLVITDLNMPHMSGHEFISLLQKNNKTKEKPIVVLSSSKDMHDVVSVAQKGIRDYILKPIEAKALITKLNAVLARQETQSSNL